MTNRPALTDPLDIFTTRVQSIVPRAELLAALRDMGPTLQHLACQVYWLTGMKYGMPLDSDDGPAFLRGYVEDLTFREMINDARVMVGADPFEDFELTDDWQFKKWQPANARGWLPPHPRDRFKSAE